MKLNLVLMFVIALFAASVYSAAPDAMTTPNPTAEKWLSSASTYYGHTDTLKGADSIWLYKGLVPEIGKEYNLIFPLIDGAGSDSTHFFVYLDCYDGTTKIERELIDSVVAAPNPTTAKKIALPVGQTVFGTKYNVVIISDAANGGLVALHYTCGFKAYLVEQKHMITY